MLTPLYDKVVLEVLDTPDVSEGGILFAAPQDATVVTATVIAVGPGYRTDKGKTLDMALTEGDTVVFNPQHGEMLRHEGQELWILREHQILSLVH